VGLAFAALLAASLLLLNYYPQAVVRRQMISAAREEMLGRVTALSAAMEGFPALTWENADNAAAVLDTARDGRLLVLDAAGVVVYDSARQHIGQVVLTPAAMAALGGRDYFSCDYAADDFSSCAASPILAGGEPAGVVCLTVESLENARLLGDIRSDIYQISFGATVVCAVFLTVFNIALGKRFSTLLMGVHAVGGGDYDYRIRMDGTDELHEVAEEFNDLSRKLQRTETMRRQFVSDASHELKTPLASIKLLSDSIAQNPNIGRAELQEFVGDISDEIGRLTRITESLLSLSRLDAQPELTPVRCDLGDTVRKCAQVLSATAAQHQVRFYLQFEGAQPVAGTADGVYHIVFNLMENAVKYNKDGGSVTVRFARADGTVAMTVADTGIGIPEEELPRIYERFYRVDKARSRATGGTGLGLSIVQEWVQSLGGELLVSSVYGEGTRFTVRLPAWEEAKA